MKSVPSQHRRGNALIVAIVLVAIILAAAIAVVAAERGGAIEEKRQNANMPIRTLDSLFAPVAQWASNAITAWSRDNGGKLPSDAEGAKIIAELKNPPNIEQAANYTAKPVYRRMGEKSYEIVISSATINAGAHLAFPYAVNGKSLAPVADNNFLQSTEVERDALIAEPGAGTVPG